MELNEILEDLKADLDEAKNDLKNAKELAMLGKEVGMSVVKYNADIRTLENQARKYEKALDRRLNGNKSKK